MNTTNILKPLYYCLSEVWFNKVPHKPLYGDTLTSVIQQEAEVINTEAVFRTDHDMHNSDSVTY